MFVAQISLTSTLTGKLLPILITSLFWIAVSSLAWSGRLRFPISSRKRVPPDAVSNRPALPSFASVNAPRV